ETRLLEGPPGFPPLFPELSKEEQQSAMLYISHADPTERRARIERVNQSIQEKKEKERNYRPAFTTDLLKGAGMVFCYDKEGEQLQYISSTGAEQAPKTRSIRGQREIDEVRSGQSSTPSSTHSLNAGSPTGFCMGVLVSLLLQGLRVLRRNQGTDLWLGREGSKEVEEAIARCKSVDAENSEASIMDCIARCRTELAKLKRTENLNSKTKIDQLKMDLEKEMAKQYMVSDTFSPEDAERIMLMKQICLKRTLSDGASQRMVLIAPAVVISSQMPCWNSRSRRSVRLYLGSYGRWKDRNSHTFKAIVVPPRQIINALLEHIEFWRLDHVVEERNEAANLIAKSVTTGRKYHSYIASQDPAWLQSLLILE
ncbi:hypothetical protein HID58_053473, partial [Brassica napus]